MSRAPGPALDRRSSRGDRRGGRPRELGANPSALSIRLPVDLHDRVVRAAARHGIDVSDAGRLCLQLGIEALELVAARLGGFVSQNPPKE
jgi:hypothetical protein